MNCNMWNSQFTERIDSDEAEADSSRIIPERVGAGYL